MQRTANAVPTVNSLLMVQSVSTLRAFCYSMYDCMILV